MLNGKMKDDLFYVCSLIEFIARKTKNYTADVVKKIGQDELSRLLDVAEVNHCLSFEQVSDEVIEECGISDGEFDMVANCKYTVPRFLAIGRLYQRLIEEVMINDDVIETLYNVFTSFLSYEISNYNSALYYSGQSYLRACYLANKIVA